MTISAEQLARIVLETMAAHASGPYDLTNPSTIWDLIGRQYPEIDGISDPPSADEVRRRYIGDFFAQWTMPDIVADPPATIGPESRESIEYNRRLRSSGVTPDMMDPRQQALAGLDTLRGNPMAALSFVTSIAMGRNRTDAMLVARATGAIFELVTGLVPAPVSDRSGEIESMGGPTPVVTRARVPDPYSPSELRARFERGYHGGV